MRYLIAALLVLALRAPALAATNYVNSACDENVKSSTRTEDHAHNEYMANDFEDAYIDFQKMAVYRANCVDDTNGRAWQWNVFYEAYDYWGMGLSAEGTLTHTNEAYGYFSQAAALVRELDRQALEYELEQDVSALHSAVTAALK